jgi:predicted HD phosphohydrolase
MYFHKLSDASVHSLNLQGGPMSEAEIINFKRNPNLKQILTVRLYDDAAKVPKMATPSFRHFAPLVHKMLNNFVPANG